MIWVTWRQHRAEVMVIAALFVLLSILLILSGINLATNYQQTGIGTCLAQHQSCESIITDFGNYFNRVAIGFGIPALFCLPILIGVFIGAPAIARELENGTYRLAWTQSMTRSRWLAIKMSLLCIGTVFIFSLLSVCVGWWGLPIDSALGPWVIFDLQGSAPITYAVCALLFGFVVGTIVRKTIPAMAITLFGMVVLRLFIELVIRPHFMVPERMTWSYDIKDQPAVVQASWVVSKGFVDTQGNLYATPHDLFRICGITSPIDSGRDGSAIDTCAQKQNIKHYIDYQPANRFWIFQGIESTIFLCISFLLIAVIFWWFKRKVI